MTNYNQIRNLFVTNPQSIIDLERLYFIKIINGLKNNFIDIKTDFDEVITFKDYWIRYAPKQRGHKPRGTSLPWGEVGEKVLEAYTYKTILSVFNNVRFVGLPYGHDIRFLTDDSFVQIDIKSTGPTDNPDEVVSSPNQVTGDGKYCDKDGIINSKVYVTGPSKNMEFQPELPPFYVINNKPYLTLTYYLKCVYKVILLGNQPLDYLELICVPNGLIMFETFNYSQTDGLFTPGKDIISSQHKRTRIKLNPLSKIEKWRCEKIYINDKKQIVTSFR